MPEKEIDSRATVDLLGANIQLKIALIFLGKNFGMTIELRLQQLFCDYEGVSVKGLFNKNRVFGVLGFILALISLQAMASESSSGREVLKFVRATDQGSYSVCDRGFHFFFFSSPYTKAEDQAQERATEKAKDQCENNLGGKYQQTRVVTQRCIPIYGMGGVCGFDCTAESSGKCKITRPENDPRVSNAPAEPKKVTVQGKDYLIDENGAAHEIVRENKSEAQSAE